MKRQKSSHTSRLTVGELKDCLFGPRTAEIRTVYDESTGKIYSSKMYYVGPERK